MLAQDDRLATRVGAIALLVLGAAVGFFVFVYGRIEWTDHVRVRVYFHQIANLHEGAPITIAGHPIGAVEAIARSPEGAATPLHGDEGVEVTVALDARAAATVLRGGDVFLASKGAFSERYLEIGPSAPRGAVLAEGDQILGSDPPSLDRVLQNMWDNLQIAARFTDAIRPELTALRGELSTLSGTLGALPAPVPIRADLAALLLEAARTRDVALGGDAGLARIQATLALARATLAELRVTLAELDARAQALRAGVTTVQARLGTQGVVALAHIEDAIARTRAAMAKIDPMLATAQDLADRLARGEGTIGKLAHDPEFPEDAKDLGKIMKRRPWRIIAHPIE